MNSINRKPKHISIWIIIYSGASVTILAGDLTKPFSMYSTKNTEWKTQEGSFNTNTTINFFTFLSLVQQKPLCENIMWVTH